MGANGDQKKNEDYPDHSIVKTIQNTETGPGDLRRQTATQTLVKTGKKNSPG